MRYQRTKLLLTGITALFLATGTAQAVEWQCGPHYVSTMVLHGENWDKIRGCKYPIIAYPSYNRTREEALKDNPSAGGDEEIGLPKKGFRWDHAPHPKFRGQCLLTYRGKPCIQYKEEPIVSFIYEYVVSHIAAVVSQHYSMTQKEINEIRYLETPQGPRVLFPINTYHISCHVEASYPLRLSECEVLEEK